MNLVWDSDKVKRTGKKTHFGGIQENFYVGWVFKDTNESFKSLLAVMMALWLRKKVSVFMGMYIDGVRVAKS